MEVLTAQRLIGPVTLAPIGDLQLGSSAADVEHFKKHIDYVMKQPNPVFLGMGDYVDVASPSNRQKLRAMALYDSVEQALVEAAERHLEEFLKLVKGTENRWLGLLEGHHFYEFADGTTSDTRICQALNAPFLGSSAFVNVPIGRNGSSSKFNATVWCSHGEGSGARASAPLNKLENLISGFEADIYLIGHMSKKAAAPLDQLYVNHRGNLAFRTKLLAGTGGFAQGYKEGSKGPNGHPRGSYVEKGLMKPVSLGAPLIHLDIERKAKDNTEKLGIHISI